jgi:hypothetical protein
MKFYEVESRYEKYSEVCNIDEYLLDSTNLFTRLV